MAIIGIDLNRENPTFTKSDFIFWMPQFRLFFYTEQGVERQDTAIFWTKLYTLSNNKIFYSIFGTDWEMAISLCIAHYLTLIGQQQGAPSGATLGEIAGGGVTRGVLANAQIGGFSKTYDLTKTMLESDEALFWNQTSYGSQLMALLKTKAIPSIMVITNYPVPEKDPFERR